MAEQAIMSATVVQKGEIDPGTASLKLALFTADGTPIDLTDLMARIIVLETPPPHEGD